MTLHRLNFLHWPISTKLTVISILVILLPILLIMAPTVTQSRIENARDQNRIYLHTLGALEASRIEQTLQTLVSGLDMLLSASSGTASYMTDLPTELSKEAARLRQVLPSISRVRFLDAAGEPYVDTLGQQAASTPADQRIQVGQLGPWSTVSDIYVDTQGNPSLDVIFTFRQGKIPAGYVVFTQNLALAESDPILPDLYAVLRDIPEGNQDAHIILLNQSGQLISHVYGHDLLEKVPDFEAVITGDQSGVSVYTSALLNTEVMGHREIVSVPDGPTIVVLIETSVERVTNDALQEVIAILLMITLGGLALGTLAALISTIFIARPLSRLTETVREVVAGRAPAHLPQLARRDEIGILNNTFGEMIEQFLNAINELEKGVAERTKDLETTLEIGRMLTSIRNMDSLLEEVVNLIRSRFDKIYHVQVFLIDTRTNQAKLRASTGAVGRHLLERGHYLDVGSQSVIGSVTASGHAVVALDTSNNPIHKRNEFLPDTRAEMALPLRVGNRIIGALDLQSIQADAFTDQDVELFQGMADQITIAIENAILFAESNARLREIETLNRLLTRAAWQEVEADLGGDPLGAQAGVFTSKKEDWTPLQRQAVQTRQIADQVEGDCITFAVPVILRDEVLGAVEWQVPQARYTNNMRQTALDLTAHLALTADNIRLVEQSQRTAQREALVNQISGKLIGTTDIDQILQTTVRELGLALRVSQTAIQLDVPTGSSPLEPTDE